MSGPVAVFARPGKIEAKSSDDDIYEGYSDLAAQSERILSTVSATSASNSAAPGGAPVAAAAGGGGSMRPPTVGLAPAGDGAARPMTASSIRGAGYTSAGNRPAGNKVFDPLQQGAQGPAPALVQKTANSPELQAREMEKQVNRILEASAAALVKADMLTALEKAKEATKAERALCKHREKSGLADQINLDLSYAVMLNLAAMYQANSMYTEALSAYNIVVKNKQYAQAGRLRVNMGNIYYQQKKYPAAIKMYRMAMDQLANTSRDMRFKIMRNIGNAFVRLGQFQDAIQSYEAVMDAAPDPHAGFNLIICYYALGDRDKMKKAFLQLLGLQDTADEDEDEEHQEDVKELTRGTGAASAAAASLSAVGPKADDLKRLRVERRKILNRYVLTAARLIAPVIEKDMGTGFDWVIEFLKTPKRANSDAGNSRLGFPRIAMELEICKGIAYLNKRDMTTAIETFESLEKKDSGLTEQAAINLSFLYFVKGDYKTADKYADHAVKNDRYNAKALVNKANLLFVKGDLEAAKELYLEAIGVEADCVEAIYNLGLVTKRLNSLEESLQAFRKLHRMMPKDSQVIFHIANLYHLMEDRQQAIEWFKVLQVMVPSDARVLARLGKLYVEEKDDTQAFHNFSDSDTIYPANLDVVSWLGLWHFDRGLHEEATAFFERAAEIEPKNIKWQLVVASCYRRSGQLAKALELYKAIHVKEPDNIECLKFLCLICKDLNETQAYEEYSRLLKQAEREQEKLRNQFVNNELQQQADSEAMCGACRLKRPAVHMTCCDKAVCEDCFRKKPLPANCPFCRKAGRLIDGQSRFQGFTVVRYVPEEDDERIDSRTPAGSPRHSPVKTPAKNLNESFTNSLEPNEAGPAINQGRQGEDDWGGDDLDDTLLPNAGR